VELMRALLIGVLLLSACDKPAESPKPPQAIKPVLQNLQLGGPIFGTRWSAKLRGKKFAKVALEKQIAAALERIDAGMSTWRKDSELSAFKVAESGAFSFGVETAEVIRQSLVIAEATGGAFDPTVRPLIALWGFGAGALQSAPSKAELEQARSAVGYQKLTWKGATLLHKPQAEISLDLSAIAKGYAVDVVADLLKKSGAEHGMVEIGGEVIAWGQRQEGGPWKLAIDAPKDGSASGSAFAAITLLDNAAMATSGDYRQFRMVNGRRLHHIIDPRRGEPVEHGLASVTVIAATCALADAYATALMVLGPSEGLALVNADPRLEALFLMRENDHWQQRRSRGMAQHLVNAE
jgi:thiamine biosynthesis lipoprotein